MLLGKKWYRFTQEFCSPVYGNVYIGRTAHLDAHAGKKLVDAGLAEELKEKVKTPVEGQKVNNNGNGNSNPRAGKSAPSGNAKR